MSLTRERERKKTETSKQKACSHAHLQKQKLILLHSAYIYTLVTTSLMQVLATPSQTVNNTIYLDRYHRNHISFYYLFITKIYEYNVNSNFLYISRCQNCINITLKAFWSQKYSINDEMMIMHVWAIIQKFCHK